MGVAHALPITLQNNGRNYSNVHTDVARLEELGLIDRTEDGKILVSYESVEIVVPLARAVA